MENGDSDAETTLLDGSLCSEPSLLGGGNLGDSVETALEGGLHCLGAEEEAVLGDRAGMLADLAPAGAKTSVDEGGGWRLEADELGHESPGAVQLVLEFAETKVWGPKAAPRRATSCRSLWRVRVRE